MSHYAVAEVNATDDVGHISRMWAQYLASGSAEHAAAKLQQGYIVNPAATGALFQICHGGDVEAVGAIGLYPRRFFLDGQEHIGATLADFVVNDAHRSAGPALMLMRAALKSGCTRFSLVYGVPNKQSRAICRRAGMSELGMSTRYSLVLSSAPKLARRVHRLLLPVAALLVDQVLRLQRLSKSIGSGPAFHCREASFDDPAIDRIWAGHDTSLLLSDRSAAMLRWRYDWQKAKHWRLAIARNAEGSECGFIVWRLQEGVAVIGDFFSMIPDRQTRPLMQAFISTARGADAHTITTNFFGSDAVAAAFSRVGFFLADTPGDPVYVANESAIAPVPGTKWYLTDFDKDD